MSQPLTALLDSLPRDAAPIRVHGETRRLVRAIAQDSRNVGEGDCFVAVPGFTVDGHDFLRRALSAGATTFVVRADHRAQWEPLLGRAMTIVEVADSRIALAALAAAFHAFPARKLAVVGVTGTDGKSTTCYLISALLEAAGHRTGLIGGVQFKVDDSWRMNTLTQTSPAPEVVQGLLAEMVEAGCTHAVVEATSHGLALHRLNHCEFDIGVFTGLSDDHLDFHKTREAYLDAKLGLFRALRTARDKGLAKTAVIRGDDPQRAAVAAAAPASPLLVGFGSSGLDVSCSDLELRADGSSFRLALPAGALRMDLSLPGRFNVGNALLAAGVAWAFGVGPVAIQRGLQATRGVPGRMERIDEGQPFTVTVDAAATTDAFRVVLESLRSLVQGRLVVVFGVAGERDPDRRSGMGAAAADYADFAVITSENPRSEDPAAIVSDIAAAMRAGGKRAGRDFEEQPDRRAAIARAFSFASPGDYVLIAGKGAEQSLIFADHEEPWDDRAVARELLRSAG